MASDEGLHPFEDFPLHSRTLVALWACARSDRTACSPKSALEAGLRTKSTDVKVPTRRVGHAPSCTSIMAIDLDDVSEPQATHISHLCRISTPGKVRSALYNRRYVCDILPANIFVKAILPQLSESAPIGEDPKKNIY